MSCHSNALKQFWIQILSPFPLTLSEPGVMQPAGKAVSISALPNAPHSLKHDEPIFFVSHIFRTDKDLSLHIWILDVF